MTGNPIDLDEVQRQLNEARGAIRFGMVLRDGGPDGCSKDEALELADNLLEPAQALIAELRQHREAQQVTASALHMACPRCSGSGKVLVADLQNLARLAWATHRHSDYGFIHAIKSLRSWTGLGLIDAGNAITEAQRGPVPPEETP